MGSNINYNFKVDLSNIPVHLGNYDWKNSLGISVSFTSDVLNGELTILEHIPKNTKNKLKNSYLVVSYNNNILEKITVQCFKNGKLSGILKDYIPFWKYNIGDKIIDDKRDLIVIDRKIIRGLRHYKIKCNKCHFESNEYFSLVTQTFQSEYWISEYKLINNGKCPCCCNPAKIVVNGINDIATTDPWMIPFFKDISKTHIYTVWSNKKEEMVCPNCGSEKIHNISYLKKYGYLPCECSDNVSMPNKIAYYTLKNISEIENYQREYSPYWAGNYRYDNYFEYNNNKYIIEMDGSVGHGNKKYKSIENDIEGLKRDLIKNELAKNNNITLYRIDCTSNDYHTIFQNLYNQLQKIFQIKLNINEKHIMELSTKNIIKEVCTFYKDISNSHIEISKKFNICLNTVARYLEHGNKYGWCDYQKIQFIKENNKKQSIKMFNNGDSFETISDLLDLHPDTVRKYITEGAKDGMCNYNPKYELEQARKRGVQSMIKHTSKQVFIYDTNKTFIGKYDSVMDLERNSLKDIGVELKSRCVGRVCLGQRKQYKGYIFSYIPLDKLESQNNDSLLLCSKE